MSRSRAFPARARSLVVAAVVAMLGVSVVVMGRGDGRQAAPPRGAPRTLPTSEAVGQLLQPVAAPGPSPSAPAPDPRAAVEAFVAAEARGDFAASHAMLSAGDRLRYASIPTWVAAHKALLPVTALQVGQVSGGDQRAEVVGTAELRSSLDEVLGLVPARARATWVAVAEDGGWRVAHGESRLDPLYPPDAAAPQAVEAWARARTSCEAAPEYEGGLVGAPALAERLCRAPGGVRVGPPALLDEEVDATPVLAAFGPDATAWARVVELHAPHRLRVVVAPVGDTWLVVGVLGDQATTR